MNSNSTFKFMIDVGVGRSVEEWLKSQEFNVVTIGSINPGMKDSEIIQLANMEDAIIITMDKDFGELVFREKNKHKGILLLRLEDAMSEEKLAAIQNIFSQHLRKLENNFSVYQNGKLRTR